jgi:hypothetical protein
MHTDAVWIKIAFKPVGILARAFLHAQWMFSATITLEYG